MSTFDREPELTKLPADAQSLDREQVEQVARILGEQSQAAQALERADCHDGPVRFWYSSSASILWLELVQDRRH